MPRVHVVAHTHWDREWYHSAARFQTRLSRLIRDVIELLRRRPELPSFLLDGQAIVLTDHIAQYPDDAAPLSRLLAEQRLECGPWYVLPDELLVSAEALVRNLLAGGLAVRRWGGQPMRVGYSPDAFGHSGALPAILFGFGIDVAVVWRGIGGEPGQDGDLYRWRAADGSEVLLVHLPRPGYEYGANLPVDAREARSRWGRLASLLEPRARTDHWLVLAGADHHAPPADLPEAVDALREASGVDVRLGTLEAAADAIRAASRSLTLPMISGELRGGRRHTWALQGTHASRLILKRWNAHCQRLLERVAEPVAALALGRAGEDLGGELRAAWRELLENHPHDSICGTSADEVHREMLVRFRRCRDRAVETIARAMDLAVTRDAAVARLAGRGRWQPALLAFNPEPHAFRGIVEAEIALYLADVGVGMGSRPARLEGEGRAFTLRDGAGRVAPHQVLSRRTGHDLTESPRHYPDCDAVEWVRVVVEVRDLPPSGIAALAVQEASSGDNSLSPVERPAALVEAGATALSNDHLLVRVEDGGTIEVSDRASGEHYRGIGAIEVVPDAGDSYTSSPRGTPRVAVADAVAVELVHEGPLRAALLVRRRCDALDLDLAMLVSLDAGARGVNVTLSGVNARADRRLRFVAPLGEPVGRVLADGHFGPLERGVRREAKRPGDLEAPAPTAPMQRYVAVAGRRRGLTVLADGLPEYEASGDAVFITLLRAFGELSKPDLPERPGHAGWPTPTPDAQCIGPFAARLAVLPHGAEALDDLAGVEAEAARFHAAPFTRMVRAMLDRPERIAGPELSGAGLVVSAIKPAEDGRGVIVRCYNCRAVAVRGSWTVPWPVTAATLCRLDETDGAQLAVERGRVRFEAGPRAIVSLRIR